MSMLPTSAAVSEFFVLASECHTQNQFNRLHIHFENILAPAELANFLNLVQSHRLSEYSCGWLEKLQTFSPEVFAAPKPFVRTQLCDRLLLYTEPNRSPRDKTLLLCFSGNARRLMLPIALFLQCLDPGSFDLLLLRKGNDMKSYLSGLEGICDSLGELIEHVDAMTPISIYRRVITLGTSSGGFPAVMAAITIGATRGVSICGAYPHDLSQHKMCAPDRGKASDIVLVYGAEFEPDFKAARAIAAVYGGSLAPIAGVGEHNVLNALRARGELNTFLEALLA